MSSYEAVNYSLRPAKNIERKMFCEAFRRLGAFDKLEEYRYIGFGSTFFMDFTLFHKLLKITKTISIEHDKNRDRFEFNRPYSCIELVFGESLTVLPSLPWDVKTIIWLDYDKPLKSFMLRDIACVASNIPPGSIIIVTLNAHPEQMNHRIERFPKIEAKKIPLGLSEDKLGDWGTADIFRTIVLNEINDSLRVRNGGVSSGKKLLFKQLFNFHYQDGMKMLTIGGIIYDESQTENLEKAAFEDLKFIRTDNTSYDIEVPTLTLKEIRHLDKQLPCENPENIQAHSIPIEAIKQYAKIYRYYPGFVDAEIG